MPSSHGLSPSSSSSSSHSHSRSRSSPRPPPHAPTTTTHSLSSGGSTKNQLLADSGCCGWLRWGVKVHLGH